MSYEYGAHNGLLTKQTYGNDDVVSFTYDILGRAKTTTYSDGRVLTYTYTGDGQLYRITDSKTGYTYTYDYDSLGRLNNSSVRDSSGTTLIQTRQVYNANNQLSGQHWTVGDKAYSQTFTYSKMKGILTKMTPGNGHTLSLSYDALQRLTKVDSNLLDRFYTYRDISTTQTTGQVSSYQYKDASGNVLHSYGYTYDSSGNIATYTQNGTTYTYTYDAQNQLLSQTGGGKTYTYTYDGVGNILTASDGTTSHTYEYGDAVWKDLLTKFGGQPISYDDSGNPTSYYNGTRWTMAWEEGRRLVTANGGGKALTFTYDSDGLRLTKTVDGTTYNYLYAGGKLMRQTGGGNTLDFFYDESGHPYALTHNGTTYYYVTNLQGDVLAILDGNKQVVASYTYDPYGKVLSAAGTLAEVNPLRYRGYVYDSETGFYYLQSRYYDPTTCRFINADSYASTGQGILGHNMFAYCGNNPINLQDPFGTCGYTNGVWRPCGNDNCPYYSPVTVSNGISSSITIGPFTYGIQLALVTDSYGYSELQFTYFMPISSDALKNTPSTTEMLDELTPNAKAKKGIGFSLMANMSFFDAPEAKDLHNTGYQIGGVLGAGRAMGVDYNIIPNGSDNPYKGITFSSGLGSPDIHMAGGVTVKLAESKVSIYDIIAGIYNGVFGR